MPGDARRCQAMPGDANLEGGHRWGSDARRCQAMPGDARRCQAVFKKSSLRSSRDYIRGLLHRISMNPNFHSFTAMSKSHASVRSAADWVLWAHNEGFTDFVERPLHEGSVEHVEGLIFLNDGLSHTDSWADARRCQAMPGDARRCQAMPGDANSKIPGDHRCLALTKPWCCISHGLYAGIKCGCQNG